MDWPPLKPGLCKVWISFGVALIWFYLWFSVGLVFENSRCRFSGWHIYLPIWKLRPVPRNFWPQRCRRRNQIHGQILLIPAWISRDADWRDEWNNCRNAQNALAVASNSCWFKSHTINTWHLIFFMVINSIITPSVDNDSLIQLWHLSTGQCALLHHVTSRESNGLLTSTWTFSPLC